MIYFDVTKSAGIRHHSGLARLSRRLGEELGADAAPLSWSEAAVRAGRSDWFVTTELFSDSERPGFGAFLRSRRCRTAAVYADAIPLKHPHITWPHSVARHPGYMKLLAAFDRVWAISQASREELSGYWRWIGLTETPPIDVLPLGSDLGRTSRVTAPAAPVEPPAVLCLGILEPRKNQELLVQVAEELWAAGHRFDLHLVGRVNPHFGPPILARIKAARKRWPGLHYHEAIGDQELETLFRSIRATACPTLAEGCGLPLLESLWHGVPCVCSDLPVLHENADAGGCLVAAVNDRAAWKAAIASVLFDSSEWTRLRDEALRRPLPTWAETAAVLRAGLIP